MPTNQETLKELVSYWDQVFKLLDEKLYQEQKETFTSLHLRKFLGIFLYMVAGTIGAEHVYNYIDALSSKNSKESLSEIESYYQQARFIAENNMNKRIPFDVTLKEFSEYFLKHNTLRYDFSTKRRLYNLFLALYGTLTKNPTINLNNIDLDDSSSYVDDDTKSISSIANEYDPDVEKKTCDPNSDKYQFSKAVDIQDFSNIDNARALFYAAEQCKADHNQEMAKKLYQESYYLGWAPSKRFLDEMLYTEKVEDSDRHIRELMNAGVILEVNRASKKFKDSTPIDALFYEKIYDYVSYLISNNQTNDALDYLYSLLTERRNHLQSKRFVFRAYKNNIANIDKTSYDETKEIKLLDELINSDVPVITAKYIKDNRFKKIDGSDDLIKTNAIVENQSLDEGSDMEKAKELHSIAYEFWREEEYKDAQTLFNKAYNMGWAPSKTIGKSEPIDNDFSDKITGYVIYQAKNNKTNDGIRYLYGLLVNRSDSQSVQNIFNAYKNSLPAIDKTVYDESLELELLEKMIHNGDNYFFEAEKLKNERYRKALFSDKLVKK